MGLPGSFGSALALAGALAVGWVLNQVLVRGAIGATSPVAVLGLLVGAGLIAAGWSLKRRFDPSELVPASAEEDEEAFDEEVAPIDEADLEGYERDER